jgi:membrane protease YdiL (CAAX protease family)
MSASMPSAIGKRILAFIQSVRPADPAHALLLLGGTFLFIARELRWSPLRGANELEWLAWTETSRQYELWTRALSAVSLPLLVAGAATGFLCLVPTKKPLRDLATFVLFPALVSLVGIPIAGFYRFRDALGLNGRVVFHSVNDPSGGYGQMISLLLKNLGPGFQIGAAGFALVAAFAILVAFRRTTLPVRLRFSSVLSATGESAEGDRRTAVFIWIMICMLPFANLLGNWCVLGVFRILKRLQTAPEISVAWSEIAGPLILFLVIAIAMGSQRMDALRGLLHLPPLKYVGVAALIPLTQGCAAPLIRYFLARNDWGEHGLGRYMAPRLGDYLAQPSLFLLWLLLGALVEEVAWRGYLQPRLVRKYGLVRGIFLIGIVWGLFHFSGDFNAYFSVGWVILWIVGRLAEMVGLSYVLGWLTIRSGSILPAGIAHGVFNIAVSSGFSRQVTDLPGWIVTPAWAILGYVLFRYFPPPAADGGASCAARATRQSI